MDNITISGVAEIIKNGESYYFKIENKTEEEIVSVASKNASLDDFSALGSRLSEKEYDSLVQSHDLACLVSIELDKQEVVFIDENDNFKRIALNAEESMKMEEKNTFTREELREEIEKAIEPLKQQIDELTDKVRTIPALQEQLDKANKLLTVVTAYISSSLETQEINATAHELENVTRSITDCEKATVMIVDADGSKFKSEAPRDSSENYRKVTLNSNEFPRQAQQAIEQKEIVVVDTDKGERAFIPIVTKDNDAIGVIAADKEGGFEGVDFSLFENGGAVMDTVDLAMKKEIEHQAMTRDELTGIKNAIGLKEHIESEVVHNMNEETPVSVYTINLPGLADVEREKAVSVLQTVAAAMTVQGKSSPQDGVFALSDTDAPENTTLVGILAVDEAKAKRVVDLLEMSVSAKGISGMEINIQQIPANTEINRDNAMKVMDTIVFGQEQEMGQEIESITADISRNDKSEFSTYRSDVYKNIPAENRGFINTNRKTAAYISKLAEKEGVDISISYKPDDKATVTVDKEKNSDFFRHGVNIAKKEHNEKSVKENYADVSDKVKGGIEKVEKNVSEIGNKAAEQIRREASVQNKGDQSR